MKKYISMLLAAVLLLSAFIIPSASAAVQKVDYVAFGDSIASGQTPYGVKVGTSYTDLIAKKLEADGYLSDFTKEFALSGESSMQFLAKLDQPNVQAAIKEAELVTISTGANDLIQFALSGSTDYSAGLEVVNQVERNLTSGLQKIKSINPQADIYVVGYYFPFLNHEESERKAGLMSAFDYFNKKLIATASAQGVTFVEVSSEFNASYLPNQEDIHPNIEGYQVIADQFFKVWQNSPVADPFSDISSTGSQARLAIMKLAEAGIVTGNTDGTFAPKSNITRAETAIILARALGYGKTTGKPGFSDVSFNMKSYDAIAALTEAGIFAKASKFNPDKPLTRAQMARVLTQALGLEASVSASFSDVPATHWAKDEIDAVFTNGIMTGGTNARFLPENNITREQFAMTVYNVWSHSLIGTP
ncbi:S-layer homology domain-containing protein [Domibacillus sp. A3M-37]|uniref:S-layer homology domain-containing protein n=1 Tax=Domibacillus sp. A3M-37 TaxID=2962037 RepID=UPI0020B7CB72|nr:S-layer homology domain-containing protein [Domibacillus sp. A3M-37]MCP3761288.1 S-layer homology domain-containing protein [Domibacillus sp. A3M-37]